MAIDASTGIYLFEGTEQFQPLSTTLNLLANSTKSSVANLQALVQAIQAFGGNEYENSGRVVAQRGRTGFTTAGRYITDREYLLTASNVNVSSSQVSGADAPWNITWTTTSASNSCKIVQSYEYFKVLMWRGTTRTFSRYLSTSSSGVNVTVAIEYTTNSQDSVSSGTWTVLNSTTAAPGTSGNWIDVTGTIPATATNLRVTVSTTNIASGVTVTDRMPLWVKGNQRGIYAPQSPTVAGETANANRHYVRWTAPSASEPSVAQGILVTTSAARIFWNIGTPMRVTPTLGNSGMAISNQVAWTAPLTSISIDSGRSTPSTIHLVCNFTAGSYTPTNPVALVAQSTSNWIELSAEL